MMIARTTKMSSWKESLINLKKGGIMMDEKKEYLRKKIRIALLGESSLMSQSKVAELCEKFFNYGMEYAKKP